jgi:hypothetical protein
VALPLPLQVSQFKVWIVEGMARPASGENEHAAVSCLNDEGIIIR